MNIPETFRAATDTFNKDLRMWCILQHNYAPVILFFLPPSTYQCRFVVLAIQGAFQGHDFLQDVLVEFVVTVYPRMVSINSGVVVGTCHLVSGCLFLNRQLGGILHLKKPLTITREFVQDVLIEIVVMVYPRIVSTYNSEVGVVACHSVSGCRLLKRQLSDILYLK